MCPASQSAFWDTCIGGKGLSPSLLFCRAALPLPQPDVQASATSAHARASQDPGARSPSAGCTEKCSVVSVVTLPPGSAGARRARFFCSSLLPPSLKGCHPSHCSALREGMPFLLPPCVPTHSQGSPVASPLTTGCQSSFPRPARVPGRSSLSDGGFCPRPPLSPLSWSPQ